MKRGSDIAVDFAGFTVIHHNLPGKEVERHDHAEHLLFIPLQGEIKLKLDQTLVTCGAGQMAYLPPETSHAFTSSASFGERVIVMIKPATWRKAGGTVFAARRLLVNPLCREILFYLLLNGRSRQQQSLVDVFVKTLCDDLKRRHAIGSEDIDHLESKASDLRLQKALLFLQEHFDENISMQQVARHSALSVRTLNRLFTDQLGFSPKKALTHYRIAKAQALLKDKRMTATEAAFAVGYNSLGQFIKAFKEITGQRPSDFARLGQKQQN